MTNVSAAPGCCSATTPVARLARARVLVLGVGGVGAYAAEEIARAGVGHMTLIDGDTVEPSNCNRQLPALTSNFGRPKVEVVAERLREINPELEISPRVQFLEGAAIGELLAEGFDYAVDAIDSLTPKVDFILECRERQLPLISSMGSGGKVDPSRIEITDISQNLRLRPRPSGARRKLREHGVYKGVRVVFPAKVIPKRRSFPPWTKPANGAPRSARSPILPALFGGFCARRCSGLDRKDSPMVY